MAKKIDWINVANICVAILTAVCLLASIMLITAVSFSDITNALCPTCKQQKPLNQAQLDCLKFTGMITTFYIALTYSRSKRLVLKFPTTIPGVILGLFWGCGFSTVYIIIILVKYMIKDTDISFTPFHFLWAFCTIAMFVLLLTTQTKLRLGLRDKKAA